MTNIKVSHVEADVDMDMLTATMRDLQSGNRECNAVLFRDEDGWHFRIEFDSGLCMTPDESAYDTKDRAQLALNKFLDALGVEERMTAQ